MEKNIAVGEMIQERELQVRDGSHMGSWRGGEESREPDF